VAESFCTLARYHNGIILNPQKFQFSADTVEFAGFEISATHVLPNRRYMSAILDFPPPNNVTEVRSWVELVNQVSYAFSMADRMQPFRDLLKPNVKFQWNGDLQELFQKSKHTIVKEIEEGFAIFDQTKSTCLANDWSKTGIGLGYYKNALPTKPFCCPTGWKVSLVGSRFTHSAESRYAPIQGEALAVADAEKARYVVLGCYDLTIAAP
jgi:hypothetical protein